jgi:hypothetical protein
VKLRYNGPADQVNAAVAAENPDKGGVLEPGHHYEVSGDAAKELLRSEHWSRVHEPHKTAAADDKE